MVCDRWRCIVFGVSVGIMDGAGGAAGGSFESLQTVTAAGGEASIAFTSIPSTYKHLQIRQISKWSSTSTGIGSLEMRFNSDTGANYATSGHVLQGDGVSATAVGNQGYNDRIILAISTARNATAYTNMFGVAIVDIHDYTSTSKNKTVRYNSGSEFNSGDSNSRVVLGSGLWVNSSNAITRVDIYAPITFIAGSVFSLYGIKG